MVSPVPAADVILVTEARFANPRPRDEHARSVLEEDRLLTEALGRCGARAVRRHWEDESFDWKTPRAAVVRTTWNYCDHFESFLRWIARLDGQTRLINHSTLLRWNLHKQYLLDLRERGIRTVPTRIAKKGARTGLRDLTAESTGVEWVMKPAVAASARHTYRFDRADFAEREVFFHRLLDQEDMLIQPFQRRVLVDGELSLVVIDGSFTHAVRKLAKRGDFRVQRDFGGTVGRHEPTPEEVEFAENVVASCDPVPVYARVDAIYDDQDHLALMELELVEPELFLQLEPESATTLARAIAKQLPSDT